MFENSLEVRDCTQKHKHTNLKPPFGHEKVVLDALLSKLFGHIKAHGAIFVVNLPLVLII